MRLTRDSRAKIRMVPTSVPTSALHGVEGTIVRCGEYRYNGLRGHMRGSRRGARSTTERDEGNSPPYKPSLGRTHAEEEEFHPGSEGCEGRVTLLESL